MRRTLSITKWVLSLVILVAAVAALWFWYTPPELIRVGSNYAAKIICSNVFLANRDPSAVLDEDVQAPGNPLLRLMRVEVDAAHATVRTGLFGSIGDGLALFRGATGCAAVPDGDLAAARGIVADLPTATGNVELWPAGDRIEVSANPAMAEVLDDPGMTGPGMRAIVIVRDGRIIGERFGPGVEGYDQPLIGWSMTKTVNAAIVGTLAGAGRLSVEEGNLLPQWAGDSRAEITLAQLLGMESGLAFNENYGNVSDVTRMLFLEPDMAAFAANQPLLYRPGTHFSYSSGASVIVSRIWQNAFENPEEAFAWPREALFEPIGMNTAVFETDARGTFVGSSYLYASARDWARFGQLLLQDGVWNGRRILPQGWVEWMARPTEASDGDYGRGVWLHGPRVGFSPSPDPDAGFDLPQDTYWLIGHDGQVIAIIPSRRLVVVRMGLTPSKLAYKPQALVEAMVKVLDAESGGDD
ncbi:MULTISPECIES: serine hydrolase domain-containing protein [Chelativorans]|jgi:CubicO group peptidase (beta-lactamase class C family)|uniref:Beta-lactamase n=1 Tax=Chelativorans sp. (strain BNC1) TaxID=266779 RepID=Q11GQ8_CHESB|nr:MULTISPECIES: serine hydrolase [Chelativorans]